MSQMYDESVDENAEGVLPIFYHRAVLDKSASDDEGRQVYRNEEWIRMRVRGDNTLEVDRRVKAKDRERFADSYDKFAKGQEQKYGTGLPLTEWPQADVAIVKMFNSLDIYTVEQLAQFPDTSIHRLRGGQTWKQKAIKWLANSGDDGTLRDEVSELRRMVGELMSENKKLKSKTTRRKRKTNTTQVKD
ncbi:MAG: hypothetical protein OEQ74_05225 [Gammaproteobacteria bacterium]|nr:hypothetical protein [Gammaproteobacteria bacterium]